METKDTLQIENESLDFIFEHCLRPLAGEEVLKPVLLARNLISAVKHHREAHIIIYTIVKQSKRLFGSLNPEHKKKINGAIIDPIIDIENQVSIV